MIILLIVINNIIIMENIDLHTFTMVYDCMNAIKLAECEEWVKNFDDPNTGFMFCNSPNIEKINNKLNYGGHSGCSYACTMRNCQYFLTHMDEWNLEVNAHTNQLPVVPETN